MNLQLKIKKVMRQISGNKQPYVAPVADSVILDNAMLAGSGSLESGGPQGAGDNSIPASAKQGWFESSDEEE